MLRQYELVERVLGYDPNADEAALNRAYVYTVQKHGTQKRASGDPRERHKSLSTLMVKLISTKAPQPALISREQN